MHAHGGTVFLDEIGELPYALQTKLLRVLEDRRVRPVGSEREVPFDARFVFATNADLPKRVEAGAFRADLYFRINVMQIHLPPLKDRGDDVVELATLFMREFAQQLGMPPIAIDDRVRASLARYDWPGNIRELRNLIERTVILGGFPEDIERVADDDDSHSGAQPRGDRAAAYSVRPARGRRRPRRSGSPAGYLAQDRRPQMRKLACLNACPA